MHFDSEAQALAQLPPGIDGVVLEFERYRSTFLPQVWEQLPKASEFIAELKRKPAWRLISGHRACDCSATT